MGVKELFVIVAMMASKQVLTLSFQRRYTYRAGV